MRVLDLFAGLRGWSDPWRDSGHEVFTIDINRQFDVDAYININHVERVIDALPWKPDVILASPPCEAFSVMRIGTNWNKDNTPKTPKAVQGLRNVVSTIEIIRRLNPTYWVIENPMGKLRSLPILSMVDRRHVTYCQYGETRMKPTDLWGGLPKDFKLREPCKKNQPCHTPAKRGSHNVGSTQEMMSSALRSKIPSQLSLHILDGISSRIDGASPRSIEWMLQDGSYHVVKDVIVTDAASVICSCCNELVIAYCQ